MKPWASSGSHSTPRLCAVTVADPSSDCWRKTGYPEVSGATIREKENGRGCHSTPRRAGPLRPGSSAPCAIQDDGEWVEYGGVLTPEWRSSGTVHTGGNLAEDFFEAWVAAEGREGLVGGDVEDHVVVGGDGGFEIGHGFLFSP